VMHLKLLREFGILLFICFLGRLIHSFFKLPLPGSIIGMIILFTLLCTGIIKVTMLEDISKFLLEHLSFFFIPAGVGLLAYMEILKANILYILAIATITTILVMVVTGHVVQFLATRRKSNE